LNSRSYSSLFLFEYLHSDGKEKADFRTLFLNKLKNRAPFVLKLAFQIEDKMLKQKLDSKFNMKLGLEGKDMKRLTDISGNIGHFTLHTYKAKLQ